MPNRRGRTIFVYFSSSSGCALAHQSAHVVFRARLRAVASARAGWRRSRSEATGAAAEGAARDRGVGWVSGRVGCKLVRSFLRAEDLTPPLQTNENVARKKRLIET